MHFEEFYPPDLPPAITHSAWYDKHSEYFPHNYRLGQLVQYSDLASKINVQGIRGYRELYLCNHVQTSSWTHTASHSIDTRTSFLMGKVDMAWHQPSTSMMPKITNDSKYTFTSKGVHCAAQTNPLYFFLYLTTYNSFITKHLYADKRTNTSKCNALPRGLGNTQHVGGPCCPAQL